MVEEQLKQKSTELNKWQIFKVININNLFKDSLRVQTGSNILYILNVHVLQIMYI